MELDLRIAALARLAASDADDVRKALVKELEQIESSLRNDTDFDRLEASLKMLRAFAHKFPARAVSALANFMLIIPDRTLTYGDEPFTQYLKKYKTAAALMREGIEVASAVRYLDTENVLSLLLAMTRRPEENVRNKALEAMGSLAEFNLDVFYGNEDRGGLGAEPQARTVAYFDSLKNEDLVANNFAILRILSQVLSPSMQGTSWTYNAVTISRGATPAMEDVARMRLAAIDLMKRMYPLDASVGYRKSVLRALHSATRREYVGEKDVQVNEMFVRDAIAVIAFYKSLVHTEALPLVQVIEHDSYWAFHHAATTEVEKVALEVRDEILKHGEYAIYRSLIGFEGIFGDWDQLKRSEGAWDFSDAGRNAEAERYVEQITDETFEGWRQRILIFSKTESEDLATFPVYYHFLHTLSSRKPSLGFRLVSNDTEALAPFLIPLLRGLWEGTLAPETEGIVIQWLSEGRYLTQIAKSLYGTHGTRLGILSAVISKAAEANDIWALIIGMGVAASLHGEGAPEASALFMSALRELTKRQDARWASNIWHNREFRQLVRELSSGERGEVLQGLQVLPKVDYQAEEILFGIAQYDPKGVLEFLVQRLRHEREDRHRRAGLDGDWDDSRFEAIPYQLHKLHESLAKIPDDVVNALRSDFDAEDAAMYSFRGARLVKSIFPDFGPVLEERLLGLVGRADQKDISFVLAILRTYDGSPAIQSVCKAIVKAVPERSEEWNEVAAAIETTGVVSGEYGMAQAYERKRSEISPWKEDVNPRVRAFAEWLVEDLDKAVTAERKRTDEEITLRKYHYGTDKKGS
jgi:hypothetical protein